MKVIWKDAYGYSGEITIDDGMSISVGEQIYVDTKTVDTLRKIYSVTWKKNKNRGMHEKHIFLT